MYHEQQQAKRDLSVLDETELLKLHSDTARRSNLALIAGNSDEAIRLGNECREIQMVLINKKLFSL